jgi:hypothetical protein
MGSMLLVTLGVQQMGELSDGLESDEKMNHVFETSSRLVDGLGNNENF